VKTGLAAFKLKQKKMLEEAASAKDRGATDRGATEVVPVTVEASSLPVLVTSSPGIETKVFDGGFFNVNSPVRKTSIATALIDGIL